MKYWKPAFRAGKVAKQVTEVTMFYKLIGFASLLSAIFMSAYAQAAFI